MLIVVLLVKDCSLALFLNLIGPTCSAALGVF